VKSDLQTSEQGNELAVTVIKNARFVIAWDAHNLRHVYLRDVDVAFSTDGLLQVGGTYSGHSSSVVDGRNYMVMPGLINIHAHPDAEPINKGLWDEAGSPKLYNSVLYEYLFLLDGDDEGAHASRQVAVAELLKSGVTTVCDMSAPRPGWIDQLAQSGIRAFLAPMFRSARWRTHSGHAIEYEFDESAGWESFHRAFEVIDKACSHPGGRLSGMVTPSQVDTCSESLLQHAFALAEQRNLPFQVHAAQSMVEFLEMTRRHGLTPIEWMKHIGILGHRTIIGHGIFLDHHPWVRWERTCDLESIAQAGSTVAHSPTTFARRGISLSHFGKYRKLGINLGIGTDSYPHNMLDEMRLAVYTARMTAGSPRDTSAGDIFEAATVGGATALLRNDIGRLAVGSKADLVLVDCDHPAMQPCHDPLRSLIYSASERAVTHVYVDGLQVVCNGEVTTIDYPYAARSVEKAQKRAVKAVSRNDWASRSLSELSPSSLPWA
jgi:5-methylthioadenosine/S-adenosylhomocysteine deaminase